MEYFAHAQAVRTRPILRLEGPGDEALLSHAKDTRNQSMGFVLPSWGTPTTAGSSVRFSIHKLKPFSTCIYLKNFST